MNSPRRGEIWLAKVHLTPAIADPALSGRPCLVVQTDLLNDAGHPTAVVIPGTSRTCREHFGHAFPLRVAISRMSLDGVLTRETDLLIDQIQAIPMQCFLHRAPISRLDAEQLQRVREALQLVLKL